eukprot:1147863-Amphidinium_carterae.1
MRGYAAVLAFKLQRRFAKVSMSSCKKSKRRSDCGHAPSAYEQGTCLLGHTFCSELLEIISDPLVLRRPKGVSSLCQQAAGERLTLIAAQRQYATSRDCCLRCLGSRDAEN